MPPAYALQQQQQQQEIREAKRILRERIRNDWEFGPLPQYTSSGRKIALPSTVAGEPASIQAVQENVAKFRFQPTPSAGATTYDSERGSAGVLGLDFDPTEWRERQYTSGSDTDTDWDADGSGRGNGKGSGDGGGLFSRAFKKKAPASTALSPKSDDYCFDRPDSVGAQIAERRHARKQKRETLAAAEAQWNDGFAHWQRRRDAWCGARPAPEVQLLRASAARVPAYSPAVAVAPNSATSTPRISTSSSGEQGITPPTSFSNTPEPTTTVAPPPMTTATTSTASPLSSSTQDPYTSTSPLPPNGATTIPTRTSPLPPPPPEMLVPVAPPILPNHPVRQRITAHTYPEIYSKIIIQSRTPSIPLNLQTLLAALVLGWKADDEWPPKPSAPPERSIGRRRNGGKGGAAAGGKGSGSGSGAAAGVKAAVTKVLKAVAHPGEALH